MVRLKRLIFIVISSIIFAGVVIAGFLSSSAFYSRVALEERNQVERALNQFRARLEGAINGNLLLAQSILGIVALKPDLNQEDVSRAFKPVFQDNKVLRNLGVAPNMILSYVYPVDGNQPAIGLDYRTVPDQFRSAELARVLRRIVVAGPLELVQGGLGVIGRIPIYLGSGQDERFWGLASAVLDWDALLLESGVQDVRRELNLAIRGTDGLGSMGSVFYGPESLFSQDFVSVQVSLPTGSWEIGALPDQGWTGTPSPGEEIRFWLLYGVTALLILAPLAGIGLMLASLSREQKKSEAIRIAQGHFLATISHEVRNPLNSILGFVELLADSDLSALQRDWVLRLEHSARSLFLLAERVLDHGNMESGKTRLVRSAFRVQQLVQEIASSVEPQTSAKHIRLTSEVTGNPPPLFGDSVRLKQVLVNLMQNAVKFTTEGEVSLVLRCEPVDQSLWKLDGEVRDSGIGMNREQLVRIFEPYAQADDTIRRRFGGSGLGLSICRDLLRMMGSDLQVESEPGKGSSFRFSVRLPEAARIDSSGEPLLADEAGPESNRETRREPSAEIFAATSGRQPEQGSNAEAATVEGIHQFRGPIPRKGVRSSSVPTILIADDTESNRILLRANLERIFRDLVVVEAEDGQEAYEAFVSRRPDLAILDLYMPGQDGILSARNMRNWEAEQGADPIPMAVLSGGNSEAERGACEQAGIDCWLAKPLERRALMTFLQTYIPWAFDDD